MGSALDALIEMLKAAADRDGEARISCDDWAAALEEIQDDIYNLRNSAPAPQTGGE